MSILIGCMKKCLILLFITCFSLSPAFSSERGTEPTLGSVKSLKIYPNPSHEALFIQLEGITEKDIQLSISDIIGRTVNNIPFENLGNTLKVDISGLKTGMYI